MKKIGIVGAGLSGLATIKELVEAGHEVLCFEKNSDIGGVFSEHGTYDSVELTVSNYFMAYSDFMPYDESVKFWTRKEYKEYLDRYVEHFDLLKHIRFNCTVNDIRESEGGYIIEGQSGENEQFSESFSHLAICSGQFQKPNVPEIPGLSTFKGKTLHSSQYINAKDCDYLHGKKVLCIGAGESGADVVTEIAEVAEHTVLSLRRNHLFSTKNVGGANTIDMVQTRYYHSLPANTKARSVRKIWSEILKTSNDEATRLLAKHVVEAADEPGSVVTKTERIFEAEANGMRIDIGGIKSINEDTVEFQSGKKEQFDAIVFCTGFKFSLPFFSKEEQFSDIRDCYLQAFHEKHREKICFIGFARPQQGGVPLIAELQARYLALILADKIQLPENLAELAQIDKAAWMNEFYETPHVFGLVNGQRFNEKIAALIGCRPSPPNPISSLKGFYVYWFHHIWPCQFRLVGPGARQEAAENWTNAPSIHTGIKRIGLPFLLLFKWLKSRNSEDQKEVWRPTFKN